jgi:hypothetical protein
VPESVDPRFAVCVIACIARVLANVVALLAGRAATRHAPGEVLRAE